jgi:adenylate kinase
MRLKRAARVILVGAPGVGKGTQSDRLLQRFPQLQSISTGDLLRSNVKRRTPLGIKAEATIKSGGLVADDLVFRLISNELYTRGWLGHNAQPNIMTLNSEATTNTSSDSSDSSGFSNMVTAPFRLDEHNPPEASNDPSASFLLDGYPRNATQADAFDRLVPINLAVSLKTPYDVVIERIAGRWVHEPSGRVYNTTFNAPRVPGLDDVTGEKLVKRADDTEEVYRARYETFQKSAEPLLEHYAKKGVLLEIEGMSSDEISPKLYKAFEERFCAV